jgi:superfamily II DNA or RNA helicase
MQLRSHQQDMLDIVQRIKAGAPIRNIYAAVTPGAGKSWLPVIAARELIPLIADKICWVVPRTNLARQAEDVFANNAAIQDLLPHNHLIRMAKNEADPTRGHSGYVTTYQAIGMDAKGQHAHEFRQHRYILVLDEPHHIADEAQWPERLAPLIENAALCVFMSGTFERHDRRRIAFLPYKKESTGDYPDLDGDTTGTSAYIEYGRERAIAEGSIANLIFRRHDAGGLAWETAEGEQKAFDSFTDAVGKDAKAALWTALTQKYAFDLLERGLDSWLGFRQHNKWAKLLVVAHSQARAEELNDYLREKGVVSDIAISNDSPAATKAIDRFKGLRKPRLDALVTVQMAYEGMDVPQISHVVCLTGIRSKPWLEQCFARAARIYGGKSHGYIWVPDDPLFRSVYEQIVDEQDKGAYRPPEADEAPMLSWTTQPTAEPRDVPAGLGITPLDAKVGAETNSDLTGATLTAEETDLFATIAYEEGVFGLAPMQVQALISDGQLPYATGISSDQLRKMQERYAKQTRSKPTSTPVAPAGLRPSDTEQKYRDRISSWVKKHAYKRWPGETRDVRLRRAAYIKTVNSTLRQAFGPRDRLRMDGLVALWAHVQRYFPA